MNSVSVVSWNTSNAFSTGNENVFSELVVELDPGIVFSSEAFNTKDQNAERLAQETCNRLGYATTIGEYDYGYARPGEPNSFLVAVRKSIRDRVEVEPVRAGNMNAMKIVTELDDEKRLTILGVHLDDRSNDVNAQLTPLLDNSTSPRQPTVICGDMNDAHREDILPRLLRSRIANVAVQNTSRLVPNIFAKGERVRDIFQRLHMMCEGERVEYLENNGFRDVDPAHAPTIPAQRPLIQLDRFMINCLVTATDFTTHQSLTTQGKFTPQTLEHIGISAVFAIAH